MEKSLSSNARKQFSPTRPTHEEEPVFRETPTAEIPVRLFSPIVRPSTAPSPDFISDYADWADVFEAPRKAHEWIACQLIASALNGKVSISWGSIVPLDLWVLLLSESGQGRNTVTGVALDVVEAAGIEGFIHKASWGSRQAFYQQLANSPGGLYDWPEFSEVLRTLNDPKFGGAKEWMTDRYDNLRIPPAVTYRMTGKKSDTPPIIFGQPPRINILATSSFDWFITNLQQADTTGGFIPRWLLMRLGRSGRLIPKPIPLDQSKLPTLAARLKAISHLKGTADLSAVEPMYGRWYHEANARFQSQPNWGLAMPFFSRLRGIVLKLAVVYEVSESTSIVVSPRAMQRAIDAALDVEHTIFEILPTGMNQEGAQIEKMADLIRSAGADGIPQSEVTSAFKHWDRRKRGDRLQTLIESGTVRRFEKHTAGRTAQIYVHRDCEQKRSSVAAEV